MSISEDADVLKKGYRRRVGAYLISCYMLIFIAFIAPVLSLADHRPAFEGVEVWFQRSGALTTIFALLANQLKEMAERTLHVPGTWGDINKVEVLAEYERRFDVIFWIAFAFTVLGTLIWGYGDTIYKILVLHQG